MYPLLDPSRFVVFITGATSGFGAAAARRYVAAGGKVIATGRREDRLLALRDELGHDKCHIIPLDVRDRKAMQAAIAATHARASGSHPIDWPVVFHLYDQLLAIRPSPVVELNRAVALSKLRGPEEGLAAIAPLENDPSLKSYYLLLAVRGHFLHALGRLPEAAHCFHQALTLPCSEPERRFLRRMLQKCHP